ncbi:hypothetical protein H5P28_05835 [Ruficoccus amylovorans]|uniref:Uncharacterized protein n=1 Tax=Ruficoccus amylovorans TaxID=1804625 RepID=A0A842HDX0_9BACT|nr:hypothetical protein [Ruficoccus amylovorans]MBC2593777.1 hypothetical protein [Ruficoccus amylovorans]
MNWLEILNSTNEYSDVFRLLGIALIGMLGLCLFICLAVCVFSGMLPIGLALFFCAAMLMMCTWVGFKIVGTRKPAEPVDLEKLEAEGKVITEEFRVKRAFEVEEFEDEGMHLFLELEPGRILYLSGQYLYDYVEILDDPDMSQPASFPCEHFKVKRNTKHGWVYEIESLSPFMAPDEKLPCFSKSFFDKYDFPDDGRIFDIDYDQLKQEIRG